MPGFIGFAVGRTTFWDPLVNYRANKIPRDTAVAQIAASYRAWVWSKGARTVLHACEGGCEFPIASDINERGNIAGQGSLSFVRPDAPGDPLDVLRALLWTRAGR